MATRSRSRRCGRRSPRRSPTSSRSPAISRSTARIPSGAVDILREMEADGAAIVSGNTDIAVADFDYAPRPFPWMTDGVPDIFRAAAEWAHDELGDERICVAAPAAVRAPPAGRRRDDDPGLPRLARARRPRASTASSTRTSSSSAPAGPTPGSSPAGTRTSPRSATSAGSSSSTTARQATSSTATRPRRGRASTSTARSRSAEIKRTEFDVLAVANAISARGLPGDVYRAATVRTGKARPMTDRRRVVVTGMGLVTTLGNDVPTTWEGLVAGRSGIRHDRVVRSVAPDRAHRRRGARPRRQRDPRPQGAAPDRPLHPVRAGRGTRGARPGRPPGALRRRARRADRGHPRDRARRRRDAHRWLHHQRPARPRPDQPVPHPDGDPEHRRRQDRHPVRDDRPELHDRRRPAPRAATPSANRARSSGAATPT